MAWFFNPFHPNSGKNFTFAKESTFVIFRRIPAFCILLKEQDGFSFYD